MKVFKFGGASVKDEEGVINLLDVLKTVNYQDTIIVCLLYTSDAADE